MSVTYQGRRDRTRGTCSVAPAFETADPRHARLNAVQAVGRGRVQDGGLVYRVDDVRQPVTRVVGRRHRTVQHRRPQHRKERGTSMPVTGIGGFFFRADDPDALSAWYGRHLGIGTRATPWHRSAGPTAFAPFPRSTDHFPSDRQWMLNLRVTGLNLLLEALAAAGIEVVRDPEWDTPELGRFCARPRPGGQPGRALGAAPGRLSGQAVGASRASWRRRTVTGRSTRPRRTKLGR